MQNTDNKQAKLRYWGIALLSLAVVVPASARQVVNPYFSIDTLQLPSGAVLEAQIINGPPKPPPGFEIERQAVTLPKPDLAAGVNILTVPAFDWVFGCSAVSGAMIAGYYDRSGWPTIYTGPTNGGVMPLDNSSWPTWSDGYDTYPSCPLIASKIGVDGRTTRGSIEDYWVQYNSTAADPYITNGWTRHNWGEAIGDYMFTSQSMYSNYDGSTTFYNWISSAAPLTCEDMIGYGLYDGTLGRRRFYEAKGYAVTDCYNQKTDNTIVGGFSFAQFQAEIDAGRPVLLNLEGHSIVGVGYDSTTNLVYLHDTWDYSNHTMTWGSSYSGMALLSVSIVNLAPLGDFTLSGTPLTQAVCAPSSASYTIDVGSVLRFANPVTLSATGQPTGTNATFNPNPVTPAGTSAFAIGNTGGATPGNYTLHVSGAATGGTNKSIDLGLSLLNAAPGAATLTTPADGATNVSATPTFTWTPSAQAVTYEIEVATDAGFSTIVTSATGLTSPTWTPGTALNTGTPYFWRVRSANACGTGADSAMFQFTTQAAPGDCGPGATANVLYQTGFEDGAGGWTSSGTGDTWAIATTNPHSGVQHFHADDPATVSDQRLTAPAMTLPTGQNPLTMKFWHAPNLEIEPAFNFCYDGGILEVTTDGGTTWTQVPDASLLVGPYTLPVSSLFENSLAGLDAWCGMSSAYINTVVDISAYAGQTVQFRGRLGSDNSEGTPGWDLDDVVVQSCIGSNNSYAITATASPAAGGTASCTPNPVSYGANSTCTATANTGYTFQAWSGDCTGDTCVLSNVTAAKTVTANFTNGNCQATAMTIGPEVFGPGTQSRASQQSIVTQGAVVVQTGADVTFRAPVVRLQPGMRVATGAVFHGRGEAVTCPAAAGAKTASTGTPSQSNLAAQRAPGGPQPFARLDQLPAWVQAILLARGVDLAAAGHGLLDPAGLWLLFETAQALDSADRNAASDLYRLDLLAERLSLLSRTPAGQAGNGASGYAAVDAFGEWVVFQSDADDLVVGDDNRVTDIYLHQVSLGLTRRLTVTAEAAAHPALDAAGTDLWFDRRGEDGQRQILTGGLWDGTAPVAIDQTAGAAVSNHHPAISPDGRYLAYLEETATAESRGCQVFLYDRDSGLFRRQSCPVALAAAPEDAWPHFSADGASLEWDLPDADQPASLPNPLWVQPAVGQK